LHLRIKLLSVTLAKSRGSGSELLMKFEAYDLRGALIAGDKNKEVLVRDIWVFEKSLFHPGAYWRLCGRLVVSLSLIRSGYENAIVGPENGQLSDEANDGTALGNIMPEDRLNSISDKESEQRHEQNSPITFEQPLVFSMRESIFESPLRILPLHSLKRESLNLKSTDPDERIMSRKEDEYPARKPSMKEEQMLHRWKIKSHDWKMNI
ncbi:unnamed protein product, partial [Ilex paraguariensis]